LPGKKAIFLLKSNRRMISALNHFNILFLI
jgi:hypothetical protein